MIKHAWIKTGLFVDLKAEALSFDILHVSDINTVQQIFWGRFVKIIKNAGDGWQLKRNADEEEIRAV